MVKRTILAEQVAGAARVAVIEDGEPVELRLFWPGDGGVSGNIYLGRVDNLTEGLNAAFVDIGEEKKAFLSADDMRSNAGAPVRIGDVARPGQMLAVQAVREPGGEKGCRVSTDITLGGRLCALRPAGGNVGVSKKIAPEAERERLRAIGEGLDGREGMGLVIRTAAKGADAGALQADFDALSELWRRITTAAAYEKTPRLLYRAADPCLSVVYDMLSGEDAEAIVDGRELYERLRAFAARQAPGLDGRVRLHQGGGFLFDAYRVDAKVERDTRHRVWLDCGGYLVIDETEALTVIDVNSGKANAAGDQEAFILKLNTEAAKAAARILRLRDIGGIVIIDFVDMRAEESRTAVLDVMRRAAAADLSPVRIVGFTPLGLLELTRRKSRMPLSRHTLRACAACGGTGKVPAYEAVAYSVAREAQRLARDAGEGAIIVAEAAGEVIPRLERMNASPKGCRLYVKPADEAFESGFRVRVAGAEPGRGAFEIRNSQG